MKFNFKVKTPTGEYKEGSIKASSQEVAVSLLQKSNFLIINLRKEEKKNYLSNFLLKHYDQVTPKEKIVFFKQMAILIGAQVPIIISLTSIKEQTNNKYFIGVIQGMINDIEDGNSFSSAMKKYPNIFSKLSISIIRAGETSGNLQKAIKYVEDNIEKNYNLSARVKSALIYPSLVMTVFFIVGFIVVSFIVPKLTLMIKELNAHTPWYTHLVIVFSDFMATYWWAIAIIIIGMVAGAYYYTHTEDGKKDWDDIKIRLPIVGIIFRYVYIVRFTENLAVLLQGGIPIVRALTTASGVVDNVVYRNIFLKVTEEVKKGGSMSTVLSRSNLIPPMVTHMIKVGEDTGQVDTVLKNVADFYNQETEAMVKNLSVMLEPIIIIVIGIAVGFMAFAILMPIYNIAGQI